MPLVTRAHGRRGRAWGWRRPASRSRSAASGSSCTSCFAFVGYAGLTVAFAAGLMYLLQFRELKSKHFGAIFRFFPPLETLDRLGRRGLLVGFPFLTLAVLVGWAWTARFHGVVAPGSRSSSGCSSPGWSSWRAILARLGGGRRGHRGALASVIGLRGGGGDLPGAPRADRRTGGCSCERRHSRHRRRTRGAGHVAR